MSDEAAFLKALSENPGDDATRLVYADWLDERNDPRAEYIRLRQQHAQIAARINELAEQFDPTWLAAVGGPQTKPEDFKLRSGRWLSLRALRQWEVYYGAAKNLGNHERVEQIIAQQRESWWRVPYLIPPGERPAPVEVWSDGSEPRTHLPAIACVGRFTSIKPVKDTNRRGSELVVIWFQDEFAFPIDPAVREQIRAIEWEKHATDFNSDY